MTIKILNISATALILSFSYYTSSALAQELPSQQEMWAIIQKQQQQISELQKLVGKTEIAVAENKQQAANTEQMIEATVSAIEEGGLSSSPASSSGTGIGGYAELHYNAGQTDEIDLHRFVMFMSHEFNDKIRFFSELEIEHSIAGDGQVGEFEVEQAYLEFDISQNTIATVGLQLVPIGILNETHEPPTFYGIERNEVEKNIIPATWWEAGIKMSGKISENLKYDAMVHSGLKTPITGSKAFLIRSGRQKVAKADWKNTAYTGRLSWTAAPGVNFAASLHYQNDLTQTSAAPTSATLFEVHGDIKQQVSTTSELGLRALYAQWNLNSKETELLGNDVQRGWYIEPSYRYNLGNDRAIGLFARYSLWDNMAGNIIDTANKQTSFGLNYWPHQNVVLKADYQIDDHANITKNDNRFNLGVGLQF